jgi:hypothetical protein
MRIVIWLRRLGFVRGALRRKSDRAEVLLLTATVVLPIAAVPVGSRVEDMTVAYSTRMSTEQAAHSQQTVAELTRDAPVSATEENSSAGKVRVAATWYAPDGPRRQGDIQVTPGARAGQSVPLWIDHDGQPAATPADPAEIQEQASVIAVMAVLLWVLLVVVLRRFAGWALERRRMASWGREWECVGPRWRSLR